MKKISWKFIVTTLVIFVGWCGSGSTFSSCTATSTSSNVSCSNLDAGSCCAQTTVTVSSSTSTNSETILLNCQYVRFSGMSKKSSGDYGECIPLGSRTNEKVLHSIHGEPPVATTTKK
jgi:hypothetical protein